MIEITTTETSVTIKHESLTKTYPKNAVRFNVQGDKILFRDTPTDRDVVAGKIGNITLDGVELTADNAEELLINALF